MATIPTLSSLGIGSGLDMGKVLERLMAVERQPLQRLEARKEAFEAQLSGVGRLRSALDDFRSVLKDLADVKRFELYTASSSDEQVLTASAGSSAPTGSYSIQVKRLAEQHKLAAQTTYADSDTTTIGTAGDTMTISLPDGSSTTISYGGKTLVDIAAAINNDGNNPGVSASVIRDNSGYRLLLTAKETGSGGLISVTYSGADPFSLQTVNQDRDGSGGFTAQDLDAELVVDGSYTLTTSSNTVTDAIAGITLNLQGTGTATVTVDRDVEGIKEQAQKFVDAYNKLRETLEELRSGDLAGEGMLLGLERQLRAVLNTPPSGITSQYSYLAQVGITLQKDGTMALEASVLEKALQSDFKGVAQVLANDNQGYMFRLDALVQEYTQINGLLDSKEEGLQASVDGVERSIDNMEARLVRIELRYRSQFVMLDGLVAQLQSTGSFIRAKLGTF